jgi:hypothetical protein
MTRRRHRTEPLDTPRVYLTLSRSGHWTATVRIRRATGWEVSRVGKLADRNSAVAEARALVTQILARKT